MRKAIVLLASLFPLIAASQTATSLDTLRHLDVKPGGGYSALWGYTAPDGREYALIGCNGQGGGQPAGTSIIDITDIGNVHQAAFIPGPASEWREMKTYLQYAYIVSEAGGGTQIVDLSGLPDSARLVRSFNYTGSGGNISRSHTITISNGFMYLNGCAGWPPGGIVIFDLRADPANPTFVGTYEPEYIHDCYVLRDTIYGSAVYSGGGLHVANARNKAAIQEIGKITYPGSGTHNSWVTKDRRYLISTDEIGSTPKTLKFWNIGNLPAIPSAPTATFTASPADIEHNVTVRGYYAYVAWYTLGAVVVNVADPSNPVYAGGYDTSNQPPGTYNGVWGIYPYFPSGKIIAGDMQNGLWVFRFSDLAPRIPVNLLQPAAGETTQVATPVSFRWSRTADPDRDPHWYDVRLKGAGLDTTWRANDSVTTFSDLGRLIPGGEYTWNVTVRDEFNTTPGGQTFHFSYGTNPTSVGGGGVPATFALFQNYPNPFNPTTLIRYRLPSATHAVLQVYNLLGQQVAELVNSTQGPGTYRVSWDASGLPSGIYLYRLNAGGFTQTRKLSLVK